MATVNGSLEGIGSWFSQSKAQASSNYGIDSNGKVALYVPEDYRAWTSSNSENDNQAVTIEVANCKGEPNWEVSSKAYEKLIELCIDICKRNNIKEIIYTGDKKGNLTRHNMFANTKCPGPYLQNKFPEIAQRINQGLNNNKGKLYRVQVGAFSIKENALRLQEKLKAQGYDCIIKEE